MDFYSKMTEKELSQRKIDEYTRISKFINWGRANPAKFIEEVFGAKLIDLQTWVLMESWYKRYALWLMSRGGGKDALGALMTMAKMILVPGYHLYVFSNAHRQAVGTFKKLEDIAKQRIPSFQSLTDLFLHEVAIPTGSNGDGFNRSSDGHEVKLWNGSTMTTLPNNLESIRGGRGCMWFNECGWMSGEEFGTLEPYTIVEENFSTSVNKEAKKRPAQMPLHCLYTTSASDISYPLYEKYKMYSIRMLLGNPNYFVCDIDANDVLNYSSIDGELITPHLTREEIESAMRDNPAKAEREYLNKFRRGVGANALISTDVLMRNSTTRRPLLYNDTSARKFFLCYDPARGYDGSILSVFEVVEDAELGDRLVLQNVVSMVDLKSKKKTPLPMTEQVKIIKKLMIAYNGEDAAEWSNIMLYIDAGAGGGGVGSIADNLMDPWTDERGVVHRGVIDPVHKQYETARAIRPDAAPIVRLIEPRGYRSVMFDALGKMAKQNLIEFVEYDGKDHVIVETPSGDWRPEKLSAEEQVALTEMSLLRTELEYICRYETENGGITYGLEKAMRNKMHDDRAYTVAMGAYALATSRRSDLVVKPIGESYDPSHAVMVRPPTRKRTQL